MIASILMCFTASMVGVIVFLRKRSLVGEALSHAAYPGVVLMSIFYGVMPEEIFSGMVLVGAFITSWLALRVMRFFEKRLKIHADSALCIVLSLFFGIGVLIASRLQVTNALGYKQALLFLFGQMATMTDVHILIYGILTLFILLFILASYRHLKAFLFDEEFSKTLGINTALIDRGITFLLVLAIVIGIRSVGVVLMAGMLIAPAVAARFCASKLSLRFLMASLFGIASAFVGNGASFYFSNLKIPLPAGPMILMVASLICLLAFILAPHEGIISRLIRRLRFQSQCSLENGLKSLWRGKTPPPYILWRLRRKKWVLSSGELSHEGRKRAEKIVRLHRLWEVYLVDYMGQNADKVHRTAEELEHLMSGDLETALTDLLNDPKLDPHHQPIPGKSP
jgi:manganese/zinc/iron transport system permease protein